MEDNGIMTNLTQKGNLNEKKGEIGKNNNPATRYSDEFRQRAVGLYRESIKSCLTTVGVRSKLAKELGIADPTLRDWILKADARDTTINTLSTTELVDKVKQLENEVKELRIQKDILKAATTFFARELDPQN